MKIFHFYSRKTKMALCTSSSCWSRRWSPIKDYSRHLDDAPFFPRSVSTLLISRFEGEQARCSREKSELPYCIVIHGGKHRHHVRTFVWNIAASRLFGATGIFSIALSWSAPSIVNWLRPAELLTSSVSTTVRPPRALWRGDAGQPPLLIIHYSHIESRWSTKVRCN